MLLLLAIGAFVWYRRRGGNASKSSAGGTTTITSSHDTSRDPSSIPLDLWSDAVLCELRLDADNIVNVKKLGTGSFGVV